MLSKSRIKFIISLVLMAAIGLTGCFPTAATRGPAKGAARVMDRSHRVDYEKALEHLRSAEYDVAEPLLRRVVLNYPKQAEPVANLGLLYARNSQWADARNALAKALALEPNNPMVLTEMGVVHRQLGEFKQSADYYRKALAINPNYRLARFNLGILFDLYLGQPDRALEQYRLYQELSEKPDEKVALWIADLERGRARPNQQKP